jgi:plastocyanin
MASGRAGDDDGERIKEATMGRTILILLAAVATLALAPVAGAETKTVQVARSGFSPASSKITVGDTVTFRNADTRNHQVVADDGSFASPVLSPGQTYSVSFAKAGTFGFHDGLRAALKGSVVVNGPPTQLSISAAAPSVVYGSSTTLSGTISTKAADQTLTLSALPTASKLDEQADVTTSDANGAFQFGVSPTIRTVYRVQLGNVQSPPLTLFVRPRVGFGRSGAFYTAKVTSDLQYGGHFVYVQRRDAFGTWHSMKKAYLSGASRARFKLALPHGRSFLRIWLPGSQAGVGYIESTSRTLGVRHR